MSGPIGEFPPIPGFAPGDRKKPARFALTARVPFREMKRLDAAGRTLQPRPCTSPRTVRQSIAERVVSLGTAGVRVIRGPRWE